VKAVAIIPARLASTRLPRKMLREIAGKVLVGWVYEAVRSSPLLYDVIIAADSEEIMEACRQVLARHKVPTAIRFVRALEVSASGKLARPHA
jgi:CMP-2-keto-3-deoxyoctulosonic acid synthetase